LTPNHWRCFPGLKIYDVVNEALLFTIGGSHTTAYTMVCGIYHLISLPQISRTLREELEGAALDVKNMNWDHLKRLPYLVSFQVPCHPLNDRS
jgi:cytochrome P450